MIDALAPLNSIVNWLAAEATLKTGLNLAKPASVCIKMTMECNSRCAHCDIWRTRYNEKELTTAQWFETLKNLRRWLGRFNLVITGGEAMLRPDMPELLEYAAGLGIHVELLSNGLIVDDALAGRIAASGVKQVTLSFDGINAKTHDVFRGAPGFHERTKAAILALDRHRKTPMKILLKTVISRNNLAELAEIGEFALKHGFHLRYQPIEDTYAAKPNPDWYKSSPLWVTDLSLLKLQITLLKELKASGALIDNTVAELDSYIRYFEDPTRLMAEIQAHELGRSKRVCKTAVTAFGISSNGDVRMCYKMAPIGNVAKERPEKIWASREKCWRKKCGFF